MSEFLKHIRQELIADCDVNPILFDYIDDRINEIISDKLSQCMGDLLDQLKEEFRHE